ncbi:MAG: helicase-exonuclease AddAB subunit AddA [Eubacteriales bacterium]|jgi:ATP-dependent helicase/nuclease subunit A
MAELSLSPQQRQGVGLRGGNILVSAAAGSGKTFVLVERIVSRLLDEQDPCDVDQFLLVTFTRAAASEMRTRLAARIRKEIQQGRTQLTRQLTLLHKASINTVHGFCGEIIRSHFHQLGIPYQYRVSDENEDVLLRRDTTEELLEERFEEEGQQDFEAFAALFAGDRSDEDLVRVALQLYRMAESQLFPEKWIKSVKKSFEVGENVEIQDTIWGEVVMEHARRVLESAQRRALQGAEACEDPQLESRRQLFIREAEAIARLREQAGQGFDALVRALNGLTFDRMPSIRGYDKGFLAWTKSVRDGYKEELTQLRDRYFYMEGKQFGEDLRELAPAMRGLAEVTLEFARRYRQAKLDKNLLTFNDMEHYAIQLLWEEKDGQLCPTDTARELAGRYREILVDEYQDTNQIQSAIFEAIARDNLFMVGDVKQSIYKFRQAQPEIFIHKLDTFGQVPVEQMRCQGDTRIVFSGNYRSRGTILEWVNVLFRRIMSRQLGEIVYDRDQQLDPRADYPPDPKRSPELLLVEKTALQEELSSQEESDAVLEAHVIAQRILQLMDQPVYDSKLGRDRPANYEDVAILLRSQKNRALLYEQVLHSYGIPCHSEEGENALTSVEVMVMLALLRVVDNPRQDIPLITVLRSPLFGWSEDTLLRVRLVRPHGLYYDAVVQAAEQGESCCQEFLERLARYRVRAREVTIDVLLWELYEETGYRYSVQAMPGGQHRAENLKMLYLYAQQYEQSSYKGLFHFIHYIDHLMEVQGELAPAQSSGDGGVQILTIHKSKGLEFPICFVANCGKGFNLLDLQGPLLLHGRLLAGPQYVDRETSRTWPTIAKEAIALTLRQEMMSEEERVLYVALTRAKDRLIMVGCCDSAEKLVARAASRISGESLDSHLLSRSASYLEWITAALLLSPEGQPLRDLLPDIPWPVPGEPAGVQVRICRSLEDLSQAPAEESEKTEEISLEVIGAHLAGEYDQPHLREVSSKLSVTELKGRALDAEVAEDTPSMTTKKELFDTPRFIEQDHGLNAAQRGTALHCAMQFIRLEQGSNEEQVRQELERMVAQELLTAQQAQACDPARIAGFFHSELGQRMLRSRQVFREEKFNLMVPAWQLYQTLNPQERQAPLLIQGVIDCFFLEGEKAVLLDFKTDRTDDAEELKRRYQVQMDLYARAIWEIYGFAVEECYLYLFHSGRTLKLCPAPCQMPAEGI